MPTLPEHQVYIITNKRKTVFYVGLTDNLRRRLWQHKYKLIPGFTAKYNVDMLVYSESLPSKALAAKREKEIKSWSRQKKFNLIKSLNPNFQNLSANWFGFKE